MLFMCHMELIIFLLRAPFALFIFNKCKIINKKVLGERTALLQSRTRSNFVIGWNSNNKLLSSPIRVGVRDKVHSCCKYSQTLPHSSWLQKGLAGFHLFSSVLTKRNRCAGGSLPSDLL